jgi:hypothetical protein
MEGERDLRAGIMQEEKELKEQGDQYIVRRGIFLDFFLFMYDIQHCFI